MCHVAEQSSTLRPPQIRGFPSASDREESTCNVGDLGVIPGWGNKGLCHKHPRRREETMAACLIMVLFSPRPASLSTSIAPRDLPFGALFDVPTHHWNVSFDSAGRGFP